MKKTNTTSKAVSLLCWIMLVSLLSCGLTACATAGSAQAQVNEPVNLPEAEITYAEGHVEQAPMQRTPVDYTIYEPFGLQYDKAKNELYFEGEPVRYFYDGGNLYDEMGSVYCEFLNEKGTIDLYATRKPTDNEDGSIDPFGELTGIERYSQEEFAKRDLSKFHDSSDEVTSASGNNDPSAKTFAERFGVYKEFGIEYVEAQDASGIGNVYYNGQLVDTFTDKSPNGGTFSFHSTDGGEISVQTVYDKEGKLAGIEMIN